MSYSDHLNELLATAKTLARGYYRETKRPLGITGEVAEYEAIRLLKLDIAPARQAGWDASRMLEDGKIERLQIKGRCVIDRFKPSAKVGRIDLDKEWDATLLVLLNADYDATVIYRAERDDIARALTSPGSRSRNERGQLTLSKFKSIGAPVWTAPPS